MIAQKSFIIHISKQKSYAMALAVSSCLHAKEAQVQSKDSPCGI
jgi:hypothetical protein